MILINDEPKFKLLTGVTKKTFFELLNILQIEYDKAHKCGSNNGIGPGCRLVLTLTYWREYRGMRQMAFDYEVSVSTVCNSIHWVEDTLVANDKFKFGNIKEEKTLKIINYYNAVATTHDFKILKESNVIDTLNELKVSGKFDSGYQGVQKELNSVSIPYKKSKNYELTEDEKEYNKNLSSIRIRIEHVNRTIKIFRIMKETYRNHQKRYDKKLKIMCTIYNMNLG